MRTRAKVNRGYGLNDARYLKLIQSPAQTVTSGKPIFSAGSQHGNVVAGGHADFDDNGFLTLVGNAQYLEFEQESWHGHYDDGHSIHLDTGGVEMNTSASAYFSFVMPEAVAVCEKTLVVRLHYIHPDPRDTYAWDVSIVYADTCEVISSASTHGHIFCHGNLGSMHGVYEYTFTLTQEPKKLVNVIVRRIDEEESKPIMCVCALLLLRDKLGLSPV